MGVVPSVWGEICEIPSKLETRTARIEIRTYGMVAIRAKSFIFRSLGVNNMKTEDVASPEMTRRFQEVQERLTDTAKNVQNVTDQYVHDNPWRALTLAAVVGCVLGFLIGHNNRS